MKHKHTDKYLQYDLLKSIKTKVAYQKFLQNLMVQQVSTNHIKWQAPGQQVSDSGAGQAIVFYSVNTRRSTQATLGEGRLTLHPSNLPRWPVAKPQTSRDYIVPPNHEASTTVGIFVMADSLIMGDGDAEGPLCIPTSPYREESSGANSRKVTCQGERTSNTTRRQMAGFLCESVNCTIMT
ncbi:hypothetical protein Pcinc_006859 [Petrolisthes cinctipes]|uniref:Uncharacterized protein n=1 Tax=Petrolisthes cinctipes TaxID=88211 RepID=A0AAE1KZ69_PETCI|nr:hypothetical protein Pcinc_006859 [Petrolisthes cinctipes]